MAKKVMRVDVHLKSGNVLKLRVLKFDLTSTSLSWTTYRYFWQRRFHPIYIDREAVEAVVHRS